MQELPAENEVLHQVILAMVSAAFLMVAAMSVFLCGFCNFFKKSSDLEQKQPILGMDENGQGFKKQGATSGGYNSNARKSSPVISTGHMHQDTPQRREPQRAKSLRSFTKRYLISPDGSPSLVPGQTNIQRVQPPMRRSQSTPLTMPASLSTVFEQPDRQMVVGQVQPDAKKLGKQTSVTSANSAFSFASGAFGLSDSAEMEEEEYVGKLQFSIKYEFTDETLIVKIFKAIELLAKDFSGTSDPFVKVLLLPNKKHKMETKVKRKKLNPVWNETFLFEGFPYNKLQERILHLEVLDYDRFSRNDPIGELNIPLSEIDLTQEQQFFKALSPSTKSAGKLGKILVSLCFAPTAGRITIVVMKCDTLAAKDITGKSDPYVKIWHVFQEKKIEKRKTIVKYNTLNPVYNVSFLFHVSLAKIRDTSFIISVIDHDRLSKNDTIGGIILGPKASPSEANHWNEMMNKPRVPVAQWHVLKDMG
ncbi:synaptotagmin-7-like isoform X2 [Asterias amurensis]|uniref:synaptotagmin-7-like isoform X2 n=1 Tax=Asterias amurensis TaxID=7602 RepID=UPI003AB2665F